MSLSSFNNVKISGITAVVPEHFINIDDEIEFFNNDPKLLERNKKILGLGKRHVADDRTTNCDLCEAAARDLIDALKIDKSTIDALIAISISHDYHWPATSCIMQGRLNLSKECTCFDISGLACSAYVHGLWLAHSLISSGASKKCLIVAGDLNSLHSDRRNRNSNMLFGDAGTATLLEYTDEENPAFFYTGTQGNDWDKLIAPAGGYALPIREDIASIEVTDNKGNVWHLWDDLMKGFDVFKFATETGPRTIFELMTYAGKSVNDIDYFAFHQANKQIVQTIAQRCSLPSDKWSSEVFSLFGNCSSASVVTDVCHHLKQQAAKTMCLATFGVGLSWGIGIVNMQNVHTGGIKLYKTPDGKMNRDEKIKYWIAYFKGNNNDK